MQAAFGRRFESSLHCVLDFGFRLAYIVQAAFTFCGADETRGKTSARRFLRLPAPRATGGVQCGYGGSATPCAPSRHAIRHSKSSLHFPKRGAGCFFWVCSELVSYSAEEGVGLPLPPKGSLHFADNVQIQYAGCFFKFAANLSPLPRERVKVRAFSDGANFNFCMAAGLPSPQPSPTGEGVGFQLPSEGGLHLNMTAKCRLPLPRAATLSVAMAAQRHADRSDSEIYSRLKLQ